MKIIVRSAGILGVEIDGQAAEEIAMRSRGTPRIANALLRRVRDFAQVMGDGHIDLKIAKYALDKLRIDTRGLDSIDNKILRTIITTFKGGPVGANTIATAIGEDQGTYEEVYEPFLIKEGELPFKNKDYLFIPDIRKAVCEKADSIKAYRVGEKDLTEFELKLGELTDEERQIILKGCLINYNRV